MKKNIKANITEPTSIETNPTKSTRTRRNRRNHQVAKKSSATNNDQGSELHQSAEESSIDAASQNQNKQDEVQADLASPKANKANNKKIKYRVFQIYYDPAQKALLEPSFAKFDNSQTQSDLYEFEVFTKLVTSEYTKDVEYWGALSWKFKEKTMLNAETLIEKMDAAPGYDVYVMNPNVDIEALYPNVWMQGAVSHHNFMALSAALFKAAALPLDKLSAMQSDRHFMTSNYFIGNHRFWKAYMLWISKVLLQANQNLPENIRNVLRSKVADDRNLHGGASYMPFMIERLFGLFLELHPEIRAHRIELDQRIQKMNVHLRLLREMRAMAIKSKSKWLASCWINYRNLYLSRTKGNEWCKEFLPKITPNQIIF